MRTYIAILTCSVLATSAFSAPVSWDQHGWKGKHDNIIPFTSTYNVVATPDQVVNGTEYTGGLPGAIGYYDFGINSDYNLICFYIRLYGFKGKYESLADTATHVHEAPKGGERPTSYRLAEPNEDWQKDERVSIGCLKGPFETGLVDEETGLDYGTGFHVSAIEANPAGFFCDVHSSLAVPGAVRGQLG